MNAADLPEPRDVRERGRWSLAQRAKNDALFALVRTTLLASKLPERVLVRAGRALGLGVHAFAPRLRRLAEAQLERALPGCDARALARATFVDLGACLGEAFHAVARGGAEPLPFPAASRAVLEAAMAEGRGVVLASAHLGPFERVAATLAAAAPLVVVARESYDPRLMNLYARLRPYPTVYRGAPGAGVRMLRVLRQGGVLGIPMDLRTRAPSVDVPFVGIPAAPVAVGPAKLALRTGAAVVVATAAPAAPRGALEVTVTRVSTDDLPAGDDGPALLTARMAADLERRIRALPTLWPWMHARG